MSIRKIINSVGLGFQNLSRLRLPRKRFVIDDSFFPNYEKFFTLGMETPQFFIDQLVIKNRYLELHESLCDCFPQREIAYSFKTNYEVAKLGIIKKLGITAEVVSGYEYSLARKLGYLGRNIIFNGPYKKDSELLLALREGAMVNLDTWRQVDQIIALKNKLKKKIQVGIRVSGQIHGLGISRFGYSMDDGEALSVIKRLSKYEIEVVGFHRHIGTDIYSLHPYQDSAFKLGSFVNHLPTLFKQKIQYIDVGGGYPGHGLPPFHLEGCVSEVRPIGDYTLAIKRGFESANLGMKSIRVIVEPGRYLVGDAGLWVVRVLEIKKYFSRLTVLTDGALTQLPLKHYCPQIIRGYDVVTGRSRGGKQADTVIYGSTCKEDDILFEGEFPSVCRGDVLVFFAVGAYNQSMGSDFIYG